jgi:hypothetical protein
MEHNPYGEAKSSSDAQEIPIFFKPKIYYCILSRMQLVPIQSQINPIHILNLFI